MSNSRIATDQNTGNPGQTPSAIQPLPARTEWEHVGFVDLDTAQIMVGNPRFHRPSRKDCDCAHADEIHQVRRGDGFLPSVVIATHDQRNRCPVSVRRDHEGLILEIKVRLRNDESSEEDWLCIAEQHFREHGGDC